MKTTIKILVISILVLNIGSLKAQTINWASLDQGSKHMINVNFGLDNGVIYGIGYGYQVNSKLIPVVANIEYSCPAGKHIFDDFKVKLGAKIRWIEFHNFQVSTNIHGIFRKYNNDFVRMMNFGSDLSAVVGYYRPKWFVAGEVGFDKAIISHFKHSQMYRDQYAGVIDGWYEPSVGGNFYYGLQTGFSFKKHDISLKGGMVLTQDFKTTPMLPFYGQLGYNFKF